MTDTERPTANTLHTGLQGVTTAGALIVVSAVNLRKGGTLAILRQCLHELSALAQAGQWRVVALVHCRELCHYPGIEYIEMPWSSRSWVHRLWCEYVTMHGISKRLGDVDLWLSLHDTTPRVRARCQAVYCHNSYPFFRWRWRHVWQNYRIVCFALFTRWFYRINLHRNRCVIVQQEWFRQAFAQMFRLPQNRIVVLPPTHAPLQAPQAAITPHVATPASEPVGAASAPFTFIYPAYPDVHKNMECVCQAAELLERAIGTGRFRVLLTTAPDMNRYSRWLHRRWCHVDAVRFCGFVSRETLAGLYAQADALLFASHVETWGLPISEFAPTGRPMLLADLPYAHESAAGACSVAFFHPDDPQALASLMRAAIQGDSNRFSPAPTIPINQPLASNWPQLLSLITSHANTSTR